jgi:hypothetical protein
MCCPELDGYRWLMCTYIGKLLGNELLKNETVPRPFGLLSLPPIFLAPMYKSSALPLDQIGSWQVLHSSNWLQCYNAMWHSGTSSWRRSKPCFPVLWFKLEIDL